jgi:hypothetical protein
MKVYHLHFSAEPDMCGVFETIEQAQACIDMMLDEFEGEGQCSPEDFEIEEVYLN